MRHERWASSPAKEKGLLANLVSMAASVDLDPQTIALKWWIQGRSWQPGGIDQVASDLLDRTPAELLDKLPSASRTLLRMSSRTRAQLAFLQNTRPEGTESRREGSTAPSSGELAQSIHRFCLDPEFVPHPAFVEALSELRKQQMASGNDDAAHIGNLREIWGALDYCAGAGEPVLIEGPTGCGKTIAAQSWCERSGGIGRYVAMPPGNDVDSLARAIATALGSAHGLSFKKRQVEDRLRNALKGSPLVLVLDDAWKAWPSGDCREAHPKRIQWLIDLMESGVRLALLTSEQWVDGRRAFIADTGYMVRQFDGRLGRILALGRVESQEELESVAARAMPSADGTARTLLAKLAELDPAGMHAIRHAAREAEYRAQTAGRQVPEFADVRGAVESSRIRIAHQARHDGAAAALSQQSPCRAPAAPPPRSSLSFVREDSGSGRRDLARPGILSV